MSSPSLRSTRKYLGKPDLAKRYGRTVKTIDEWKKKKVIPKADLVLNNREFWDEENLNRHNHEVTAAAAKSSAA